jgi:hypothetical protein
MIKPSRWSRTYKNEDFEVIITQEKDSRVYAHVWTTNSPAVGILGLDMEELLELHNLIEQVMAVENERTRNE